jgi:P-type Ca2+ transporter type 2C
VTTTEPVPARSGVQSTGLREREAVRRPRRHGSNERRPRGIRQVLSDVRGTVTGPPALVLAGTAALAAALGDVRGAVAGVVALALYLGTGLVSRRLSAPITQGGSRLLALTGTLAALTLLSGVLRGRPATETLPAAVSVLLAGVPVLLPLAVTTAVVVGTRRLASLSVLVRRPAAVEALGSVTAVAVEPKGTLTEGSLVAERVWAGQEWYTATGKGYDPAGAVRGPDGAPRQWLSLDVVTLLRDLALGTDAELKPAGDPAGEWRPVGDPVAAALVALAARGGVLARPVRAAYPQESGSPFDPRRGRATTVHATVDPGRWLIVCLGTPRALFGTPGLVDDERVGPARAVAADLAAQGYRVLAVADRLVGTPVSNPDAERGLRLAGLVAMTHPLRGQVPAVVQAFRDADVELVLVSGDHPETARMLAAKLGLRRSAIVTGPDLVGGGRRQSVVPGSGVFARSRPEQKAQLVHALQEHGHVVATTGGGVGDVPALRRADVAITPAGGAEAARQAADLVLPDDDLTTLAAAVREGRRVHGRVRRFLAFAAMGAVAQALVVLWAPFVGLGVALLPAQALWINTVVQGLPGLAMDGAPGRRIAPNPWAGRPAVAMLRSGRWWRVAGAGALAGAVSLAAGLAAHRWGGAGQSMIFLVLGASLLGVAVALQHPRRRRWRRPGRREAAVAVALTLHLTILVTPLRQVLGLQAVGLPEVVAGLLTGTVPGLAVHWGGRRRRDTRRRPTRVPR